MPRFESKTTILLKRILSKPQIQKEVMDDTLSIGAMPPRLGETYTLRQEVTIVPVIPDGAISRDEALLRTSSGEFAGLASPLPSGDYVTYARSSLGQSDMIEHLVWLDTLLDSENNSTSISSPMRHEGVEREEPPQEDVRESSSEVLREDTPSDILRLDLTSVREQAERGESPLPAFPREVDFFTMSESVSSLLLPEHSTVNTTVGDETESQQEAPRLVPFEVAALLSPRVRTDGEALNYPQDDDSILSHAVLPHQEVPLASDHHGFSAELMYAVMSLAGVGLMSAYA